MPKYCQQVERLVFESEKLRLSMTDYLHLHVRYSVDKKIRDLSQCQDATVL